MKKLIIIFLILGLMEVISWWVYRSFFPKDTASDIQKVSENNRNQSSGELNQETAGEALQQEKGGVPIDDTPLVTYSKDWDVASFPPPSTEIVNGVTERTIHVGVRQWEWDPKVITAKEGELVRLIMHNADVRHSFVIPELEVNVDIPEDGAVVEFQAKRKGSFSFLCGVYCGEGHAEMSGTVVIE